MSEQSRSDIADKLFALGVDFKQLLPQKLLKVEALWQSFKNNNRNDLSELHHLLHDIAGTGGAYGAIQLDLVSKHLIKLIKYFLTDTSDTTLLDEQKKEEFEQLLQNLIQNAESWQPTIIPFIKPVKNEQLSLNRFVYFVEEDRHFASSLKVELEQAGFEVRHFSNTRDFENAFYDKKPSVVIMDMYFEQEQHSGARVIKNLKDANDIFPPVIFLSAHSDIESRLAAVRAGADRYYTKPADFNKLKLSLEALTKVVDKDPYRVLIVDDSESMLLYYNAILEDAGISVKTVIDPLKSILAISEFKPELLVLDVFMPGCSGFELARVIRQDEEWALMPIIFLTSKSEEELQNDAFVIGGDEFIVKPVEPRRFISSVTSKVKRSREVNQLNLNLKNALRESEYQFNTMSQHNLVSTTDLKGSITQVNNKFCEMSEYSRQELIGENHRILKSNQHHDSFYKVMWQTISTGKVWTGIICNRKKNGNSYWVEAIIVPFLDERGNPYKYVYSATDITQLRLGEQRLKRSQEFANIGTWDWNVQTEHWFWSDRIWGLLGYHSKTISSCYDNFIAPVHPDDRQKVIKKLTDCIQHGSNFEIEYRIIDTENQIHWLHQSGNATRGQDGKVLNMLGIVRDVSKRKLAEEKQKKTEMLFSIANEASGDGVWDWDTAANTMQFTKNYFSMLGYQNNEFPQSVNAWMDNIHREDMPLVLENLDRIIEGPKCECNFEIRLRCKDGQYIWVLCSSTVISRNEAGKPERIIGINCNISHKKLEQQELINAREEAEQANKTKSEFLSSMSHELRTPMNAIIGFSQLLKSDQNDPLTDYQKDNVDEILKAGKHLLELINEVLDLARIEAGRINLSVETVIVSEVIIESLQLITPLAQNRGIVIDFIWNDSEIPLEKLIHQSSAVLADHTRLKQVLLNLLSNAVKYNRNDGKITIGFSQLNKDSCRISIADNGPGLTNEQQANLFKPFNRLGAEKKEEVEGTGIGLVITKNIVELMKGKIGFEAQVGKGCCFWVDLPVANSGSSQNESAKNKSDEIYHEDNVHKEKERSVLYIEDNPANLRLVTQLLGRLKHLKVWSAHEPLLGLELAMENRPDLILLDINLPGMNGFEVLKHLRERDATRRTPVIAISANAMPKDIEKGMDAGFDDYITKPIDINALLKSVENTLENGPK